MSHILNNRIYNAWVNWEREAEFFNNFLAHVPFDTKIIGKEGKKEMVIIGDSSIIYKFQKKFYSDLQTN